MRFKALNLRRVTWDDADFLFELFSSVKLDELGAWSWHADLQQRLLRQQFQAHEQHYRSLAEDPDDYLVRLEEEPIGRIILFRTSSLIHLADIALMPHHRNLGLGSVLVRGVQQKAKTTGRRVHLNVMLNSAAVRFYRRLGFNTVSRNDIQGLMEWGAGAEVGRGKDAIP